MWEHFRIFRIDYIQRETIYHKTLETGAQISIQGQEEATVK